MIMLSVPFAPLPPWRTHPTPGPKAILMLVLASLGIALGLCARAATGPLPAPAPRSVDFLKDIQPILADRCYSCHGPDKQKSDLRWDSRDSVFKTGEHGPILVPGHSADSRVIKLVAGLDPDTV